MLVNRDPYSSSSGAGATIDYNNGWDNNSNNSSVSSNGTNISNISNRDRSTSSFTDESQYAELGYYSSKDITRKYRQKIVGLIVLVLTWYCGAVVTITTSKEIMNHIKLPFFLCCVQFTSAACCTWIYLTYGNRIISYMVTGKFATSSSSSDLMGSSNSNSGLNSISSSTFQLPPSLSLTVFAIATSYTFGFILTNTAFSMVTAAFAETVKSTEPFTTVAIGWLFLRESVSMRTYFTLIPICFGVAFSCYHDDMFNIWGFCLAFASNFGFSLRAVLAKRLNLFHGERIDEIVMFYYISIQGLIYLVPITLLYEREGLYQAWSLYRNTNDNFGQLNKLNSNINNSSGIHFERGSIGSVIGIGGLFVLNGMMFALYNLVSYLVLRRTDLVTHSVLNAFRRVFIILFTTLYFHLSLSPFNVLGVCIAVVGVLAFGYSKAKDNKM